jgi:hypothetical protein
VNIGIYLRKSGMVLLVPLEFCSLGIFCYLIQMSAQRGPLDWNFKILDLEWCLVYVYRRLWHQTVIFFPIRMKSEITNSDQSHKFRMKYKSRKFSKHGPLEKPEIESGVKEWASHVDRSYPPCAPFKVQNSIVKIVVSRSGKRNNPQSKLVCPVK